MVDAQAGLILIFPVNKTSFNAKLIILLLLTILLLLNMQKTCSGEKSPDTADPAETWQHHRKTYLPVKIDGPYYPISGYRTLHDG